MNSDDIDRFLRRRVRRFDGAFSVDTLLYTPRLLVCNTDPSHKPRRHWICIYVKDGRGEYLDSFGWRPDAAFERYLNRRCSSWSFNHTQIQSQLAIKFCCYYCIFIADDRHRLCTSAIHVSLHRQQIREWVTFWTLQRAYLVLVIFLQVAWDGCGENGMIVVYRFGDLSHSHPLIQVQSDPLSRRFWVFLISRLEPFAKVHASEAGRNDHHRCVTTT